MQRSRALGHGVVVSKIWITGYWLCSQLCYVTAANQWTPVEIELLATVGWKWGCQPFSCRCSKNVTHGRKEICRHVCLRNPCLYWGLSLHSLPEAWGPRERQHTLPALHYACKRSHPFVAAAGKTCLMRRSRGFGNGVVVTKICYNAVIVLSVVLCDCCKPMNTCPDWAFSNSGLEVGLPAF